MTRACCMALAIAAAACAGPGAARDRHGAPRDTVRVAVAANFAAPHDSIARQFTEATGIAVVAMVGATGQLFAQVEHGAPVDVFLAADTLRPAMLEARGMASARFTYAVGRLVIYAPALPGIVDSPSRLAEPQVRHVALADSATAPYGAAALAALRNWGIRDSIGPRLVYGESIGQAYQFVASGAAEAGFVALSQVIGVRDARYYLVPDSLHPPIAQGAAVIGRAGPKPHVERFVEYLRGPAARAVMESFGYDVPAALPLPVSR